MNLLISDEATYQCDSFNKVITSRDEAISYSYKKSDRVFLSMKESNDSLTILDSIAHRCPVIYFFDPLKEAFTPNERHCSTIYLPKASISIEEGLQLLSDIASKAEEDHYAYKLIGSSSVMEDIRNRIRLYSKKSYPIHFSGSSGTGKNIAAHYLHNLSFPKAELVYVNCGSVSNNMKESDFFGHVKGAYTGAINARAGYLKHADCSTLFLDEIENMSLELQQMLLDTLESGVYKKIGSDKEIKVSFRLITASNIPLQTLIEEKRLREDFYYRICTREITMPNLDDHKEDIPELVQDFERKNKIARYRIRDYKPLLNRHYNGNIRELYKVLTLLHEENEERERGNFYSIQY